MSTYVPDPKYIRPKEIKEKVKKIKKNAILTHGERINNGDYASSSSSSSSIAVNYNDPTLVKADGRTRGTQIRDKHAPKRVYTNYLLFQKEEREKLKTEGMVLSATEIIKEIAKRWQCLSEDGKHAYDSQVDIDRERYRREMETYVRPSNAVLEARNKKRPKRDPNKPKRPKTAYLLFCDHNRKEVQNRVGINASQVMTTLAKMWKETLIPDRKIYEDGAALLKIEYDKKMMLYDPKPGDEYYTGTQRKRKRDPNAPKKPPNAYLIYSKQRREEIKVDMPDMAPKDIMSELGRGWKDVSAEKREPFEKEARLLKTKYDTDMETYNRNKTQRTHLHSDAPSSTASQNIYDERGMQILPETFKETSSSSSSSSSVNSNQRMNHHQEINHTMNRNQRSSNRQSNTRTSKSALDYYMDTKRSKVQRNHPSADRAQQNSILKRKFSMLPKNRLLKYHEMERNGGQTIGQQSV